MGLIWLPVTETGFQSLYEVSNLGEVRSAKTKRVLKPGTQKSGHLNVFLCNNGKRKKRYVHRLVLLAFVGPPLEGQEALHIDGDATNNQLENLRWGTRQENALDLVTHGTHNNARKDTCPKGHKYDYFYPDGRRGCKICRAERRRAYLRRKQEE